ncbi:unnamed protein product [Rotaria sp. Silwood2]|nr:unnamed protein product [Rotaria sp. Silwood2]CAF4141843.1 unnamed protein product [Rotaria sp. Silwood2]CAF4179837.1 unnamed protein product [Rotaria sp. Silwood2]CAF4311542.1 unnamed protein product [Rotaria sp. Silwood2]
MPCSKGAALLIGLWDLFIHSAVLCALILMFRQPPKLMNDMISTNNQYPDPHDTPILEPYFKESSNVMMHNKNFISSNVLLNRILKKHNVSHMPTELNTRNFYSNLDFMTIKWAASLNQRTLILFS